MGTPQTPARNLRFPAPSLDACLAVAPARLDSDLTPLSCKREKGEMGGMIGDAPNPGKKPTVSCTFPWSLSGPRCSPFRLRPDALVQFTGEGGNGWDNWGHPKPRQETYGFLHLPSALVRPSLQRGYTPTLWPVCSRQCCSSRPDEWEYMRAVAHPSTAGARPALTPIPSASSGQALTFPQEEERITSFPLKGED